MNHTILTNFFFKKRIVKRKDDQAYLIRITLLNIRSKYLNFSIKLHKIIKSDDMCLHDHPWKFYSFIMWGGYVEHTPPVNQHKIDLSNTYDGIDTIKKWYGAGNLLVRPAHWIHRLELRKDKDGNELPAYTFVITFKKSKEWGFFTPKFGKKIHHEYNEHDHCGL